MCECLSERMCVRDCVSRYICDHVTMCVCVNLCECACVHMCGPRCIVVSVPLQLDRKRGELSI